MKKALVFMILTITLLLCLTACHSHYFGEWSVTKNATCTEDGVKTRYCSCGEKQSDVIPSTGHNYVDGECMDCGDIKEAPECKHNNLNILAAVDSTCSETGLTEGKQCSDCGEILVAQQETALKNHTEEIIAAVVSTCTEKGLTEGKKCSVCGETLVAQEEAPLKAHTEEIIPAVESTCTETGLTEGKKCSICGETLVAQQEVSLKDHTEEIIPSVESTCTEKGLTEGKKCSVCGEVIVAQEESPLKAHNEVVDSKVAATCTKTGLTEGSHCSVCGVTLVAQQEIPVVAHTYDDKYDESCNICGFIRDAECAHRETEIIKGYEATCTSTGLTDGEKCKKCGETLTSQTVIGIKAHTEAIVNAVAPTCTSTGLTEGKHCSVCGTVLVAQNVVPMFAHSYSTFVTAPTCTDKGYTTYICDCGDSYIDDYVDKIPHTFGDWVTVKEATTTEEGLQERTCSCGEKETQTIDKIPIELEYTLNADGESYSVTGIGTWDNLEIIIPDTYKGLPVTGIGKSAFIHHSTITSVTIGRFVKTIGNDAFENCYALKTIYFNAKEMSDLNPQNNVFFNAGSKSGISIIVGSEVTRIPAYLFFPSSTYGASEHKILSIKFEDESRCESIGMSAFHDCQFSSIQLPDSVKTIGYMAFAVNENLKTIELGNNIESIGSMAVYYCLNLTSIKFKGTIEEWNAINISSTWDDATKTYVIYCTDGEIAKDGTVTYYETEKLYTRDGDYIYFGEYPQTIKSDDVTITSTQDSRGYYLGSDGYYYAMVTATPADSDYTFSTGTAITNGSVYYFKVEPICWRILSEENGAALILCDSIIANHRFDADSNNYAESEIRAWLNSTFYETAFNEFSRSLILTTEVDNSLASTTNSSNPYICENTNDNIFLLSVAETTDATYGFYDSWQFDPTRRMLASDYSRAIGVEYNLFNQGDDTQGNGSWWLRSPTDYLSSCTCSIGYFGETSSIRSSTYSGVVPALRITL